jgi:hypothetical protein
MVRGLEHRTAADEVVGEMERRVAERLDAPGALAPGGGVLRGERLDGEAERARHGVSGAGGGRPAGPAHSVKKSARGLPDAS